MVSFGLFFERFNGWSCVNSVLSSLACAKFGGGMVSPGVKSTNGVLPSGDEFVMWVETSGDKTFALGREALVLVGSPNCFIFCTRLRDLMMYSCFR